MNTLKIGILVSGRGSNMDAIIKSCEEKKIPAKVVAVVSDNPKALAVEKANTKNIPTLTAERSSFDNRKSFEQEIINFLQTNDVDLVCLAGFMRIIGKSLLEAFPNKIINIHPSLLPSFPGLDAQKQAFDYGAKVSGCTVHFVDDKMDHGPIIIQETVEVLPNDTAETLSTRILEQEHRIYSEAIKLIAEDRLQVEGRLVYIR